MLGMASGLCIERLRGLLRVRLLEKQCLTLGQVGETQVASAMSECWKREKVRSSSLLLPPICLLSPSSVPIVPPSVILTSGKLPGPYLLPLFLPPALLAYTEPLAIGHWTASLSVSLMNVSTARKGAKTKVLLRGIRCVNIVAGELHKGNGGHSLDYLLTKGVVYKRVV